MEECHGRLARRRLAPAGWIRRIPGGIPCSHLRRHARPPRQRPGNVWEAFIKTRRLTRGFRARITHRWAPTPNPTVGGAPWLTKSSGARSSIGSLSLAEFRPPRISRERATCPSRGVAYSCSARKRPNLIANALPAEFEPRIFRVPSLQTFRPPGSAREIRYKIDHLSDPAN